MSDDEQMRKAREALAQSAQTRTALLAAVADATALGLGDQPVIQEAVSTLEWEIKAESVYEVDDETFELLSPAAQVMHCIDLAKEVLTDPDSPDDALAAARELLRAVQEIRRPE